jgi:O-acetyl-ADP-ribose deacetylase
LRYKETIKHQGLTSKELEFESDNSEWAKIFVKKRLREAAKEGAVESCRLEVMDWGGEWLLVHEWSDVRALSSDRLVAGSTINLIKGDITDQDVDAIVNAANPSLMGGGGVDGAIHRRGGPQILRECSVIREKTWPGGLPPGQAVITSGGLLKARHVIHTVGPVWQGGGSDESRILSECYVNSLRIVKEKKLGSVAFPAISAGVYGYPVDQAARVALSTVKRFVEEERWPSVVNFVLFNEPVLRAYSNALIN